MISALFVGGLPALAAVPDFRQPALTRYRQAVDQAKSSTNRAATLVQLSRACFDIGEFATNNAERELFAEQGIAAARAVLTMTTNAASAHYYLGMNLGQLARTRSLGALKLVRQMEAEFLAAAAIDPNYDFAGPHRNLGLLYRDAPSFGSIGSRSKARHHLQKAVLMAPDYPENHLNLLEAYLAWGDRKGVDREWARIEELWPKARKQLTGEKWAPGWHDWDKRLAEIKRSMEASGKALKSPRAQP